MVKRKHSASEDEPVVPEEPSPEEEGRPTEVPDGSASSGISQEDELRLFAEYRADPTEANLQRILDQYVNMVYYIAHRYATERDGFDDLTQVGMLGLLNAIQRFEPERGWRFTTFAYRYIQGEVQRHFRDKSWSIYVPRKLKERSLKVFSVQALLTAKLGESPTPQQIAEEADLSEEAVLEALELGTAYHPLQMMEEIVPTEAAISPSEAEAGLQPTERDLLWEHILSFLTETEAAVIRLRFWEGFSQSEVGSKIGTSQMNVSRIQRQALAKLRKVLKGHQFE